MKSFYLGLGSMLSAKPVARLLGTRRDYYSAPYRIMSILGTHLGHIAMSDLSPKRDPKRNCSSPTYGARLCEAAQTKVCSLWFAANS